MRTFERLENPLADEWLETEAGRLNHTDLGKWIAVLKNNSIDIGKIEKFTMTARKSGVRAASEIENGKVELFLSSATQFQEFIKMIVDFDLVVRVYANKPSLGFTGLSANQTKI